MRIMERIHIVLYVMDMDVQNQTIHIVIAVMDGIVQMIVKVHVNIVLMEHVQNTVQDMLIVHVMIVVEQ